MWATVILTLDAEEVKKVRSVKRGCVEKLIRAIAKMYDEKSEVNLDTMRKSIQTCRLHAFPDLDAFFAQHEGLQGLQGGAYARKHAFPHARWPAVRVRARQDCPYTSQRQLHLGRDEGPGLPAGLLHPHQELP